MRRATLERLLEAARNRQPAGVVVSSQTGGEWWVEDGSPTGDSLALDETDQAAARKAVRDGTPQPIGEHGFVHTHAPPIRLVIVGAVHIAQALVPMAWALEYECTIIDPRRAFATPERFPGITLRHDWPDEAMADMTLDAHTALVTLTHEPRIDDPALQAGLASPVFYIGALGSTRTHASRLARLREAGFSDPDLTRIHGPIGLDLGARSPAGIALSILAELTGCFHGKYA